MKYHLDIKDPVNDEIVDAFGYYPHSLRWILCEGMCVVNPAVIIITF
jgi:hypothetical protein